MAVLATPKNIADFETRRADLEKTAADVLANAKIRADKVAELEITLLPPTLGMKANYFGSVGPRDIADSITAKGVQIEKKEVIMPEGPDSSNR